MILREIVSFSVRHAGVVAGLAVAALIYGSFSLSKAQYDVFPEFAPPQVVIQAEAPGLSPEQVEMLVTQPIENSVNGVSGIESLRSSSIQGLSLIKITFNPGSDIHLNRQAVAERLSAVAGQLPQGIQPPVLTPLTSSTSIMLAVGLSSQSKSLQDIRTQADWVVKQRLLAVPGVAKVSVFGGEVRQLQIQLKPEQLKRYNLSPAEVVDAARRATGVQGAGFIDTPNQRIVIQTDGQASTTEALTRTVLLHGTGENIDLNITLDDVAIVAEGREPRLGAASIMGKEGVMLLVSSQYGANTRQVTHEVEKALEEISPTLKMADITLSPDLFRPANFIETAIGNIKTDLFLGAAFVVIILFIFLSNVKSALISATAIPLSLMTAVVVLNQFGYTLNTMTLGGLAIAIGAVVDDAVIDVENILRRLRESHRLQLNESRLQTILNASLEVRSAVVFATVAVIVVFLPVLTMSGLGGRLFAPLAIANIAAMLASLIVALTVTPALSMLLIRHQDTETPEPRFTVWIKDRYVRTLTAFSHAPGKMLLCVCVLFLGSLAALPFFEEKFIPELREGHFIVHMSAIPGTSLDESLRIGNRVTEGLLKLPFVRLVSQRAGRAEKADDVWGTHYSEFEVDLKPLTGEDAEGSQFEIRKVLAQFPGVNFAVKPFLTERVEETLSGYTAEGVLNIYGLELDTIDKLAAQILPIVQSMPGAANVQLQSPPGTPQLNIRLKPDALYYFGLNAVDVLSAIRVAYQGETVSQVYRGNQVIDVSVVLAPSARMSMVQVGDLPIKTPSGSIVPLSKLAEIGMSAGRYVVLRDGARRVQTITFDVGGKDLSSFIAETNKKLSESITFPPGSYIAFGGAAEAQAKAQRDLLINSALAGLAIIALLAILMRNGRNLGLILLNLPFAMVGGVLAVVMTGGILTLGAMVGFVTLFGISLRNSVMMMSHFEHLVLAEDQPWNMQTALRGASERLLPIIMTALVTALGLLPLAISSGDPGREIEGPMAIVILGGLCTSTLLNLLVLPALALRFARFSPSEDIR